MIRRPILHSAVQAAPRNYNTSNLHEYDPYVYDTADGMLRIDSCWWTSLPLIARSLIRSRVKLFDCDNEVAVPHAHVIHESELAVYRSYIDAYDYQYWNMRRDVIIIRLTADEKQTLARMAKNRMLQARKPDPVDWSRLACLANGIRDAIEHLASPARVFMRLSGTSGKNEVPVEPLTASDNAIVRLTSNILFLNQEYERDKETAVILMPWCDEIERRTEFRVFVVDGRITAVSQQHWRELFGYSDEELDTVESAILGATFLRNAPYRRFVADVWVSFADKECHLIEYNPFGAHCGAGSALFEWQRDRAILYGSDIAAQSKPVFAFTTYCLFEHGSGEEEEEIDDAAADADN